MAHLAVGWQPAGINHGAGTSQHPAHRFGQLLDQGQVVLFFDAPPHGHYHIGLGDVHLAHRGFHVFEELSVRDLLSQRRIHGDDLTAQRLALFEREGRLPQGSHVEVGLAKGELRAHLAPVHLPHGEQVSIFDF